MNVPLAALHQNLFGSVNAFALLAIPFFIYAGELMGRGSVAQRLVDFVQGGVGSVRGSLGVTTVGTSTIFGAISGVSAACVATIGKVMYPAMRRAGYPEHVRRRSDHRGRRDRHHHPAQHPDDRLWRVRRRNRCRGSMRPASCPACCWRSCSPPMSSGTRGATISAPASRSSLERFLRATMRGIWALGMPFIILGGIYGGVFSPTEAAAVACVYAAFVTRFVFRELGWRDIVEAAAVTVLFSAQILIIVACAGVFSWLLTVNQVPATLVAWLQSLNVTPGCSC